MDPTSRLLHQIHARYAPVDTRVAEILDHIRKNCEDLDLKKYNEDNERQLEQFITRIEAEECGLIGLFSQLLLSLGLFAGNFALTYGDWAMLAVAIGRLPLASYRFGVSGSRQYVRTLSPEAMRKIRAMIFSRFSRRRTALHSARDDARGQHLPACQPGR